MVVSTVVTHVMPYLSSINITRAVSSLVATGIPLLSIGGRLGLGWLADRLDMRLVTTAAFIMMGLGMLCFGYISAFGVLMLMPFLILFSIGLGGNNVLRVSIIRNLFGRNNFGTIFGLIVGVNMLGSIIGPPLAGWIFDNWHSYQQIWLVFAALSIITPFFILATSRVTAPKETSQTLSQ
jgi:MFS family permease